MSYWKTGLTGATLLCALAVAAGAQAQACPADLSSLIGQVQTPSLQPQLTESLDDRVARDGGLEQSITIATDSLTSLSDFQGRMKASDDETTKRTVYERLLVISARLDALKCRRATQ